MAPCSEGSLSGSMGIHSNEVPGGSWGVICVPTHINVPTQRAWLYPSGLCHAPPSCLSVSMAGAIISVLRRNRISQCEGLKKVHAWDILATRISFSRWECRIWGGVRGTVKISEVGSRKVEEFGFFFPRGTVENHWGIVVGVLLHVMCCINCCNTEMQMTRWLVTITEMYV